MWPGALPLPSTVILLFAGYFLLEAAQSPANETQTEQDVPQHDLSAIPEETTSEIRRTFHDQAYYFAITERPLFSANRRPASLEPEPVVTEPVSEEPPAPEPEEEPAISFTLHGTMQSSGDNFALLSINGESPEWIRENDLISDWRLREVNPQVVTLEKDSDSIRVQLYEQGR